MIMKTDHPHVVQDDEILGGEPIIKSTRTPVRAIVEWWKFGATPEEILEHLPHLKMAQIFDALSYYADHQEEIERHILANKVSEKDSGEKK